jgi:hypothetical protein
MISEEEIARATKVGSRIKQAILSAKYHSDTDRIELETPWCTLIVHRQRIEELRTLSRTDLETITVSAVGLHVEKADVDINSAGLITDLCHELEAEVAGSF